MRPLAAVALLLALPLAAAAQGEGPARVGPGTFRLSFAAEGTATTAEVPAFLLDRTPVTNAEFLAFVQKHPHWQKGAAPRFLADEGYLAHWKGPLEPGESAPARAPVTRVSWFAAKAYCEAKGARLPTGVEWEFAAAADEKSKDARDDHAFTQRILGWYAQATPARPPEVGRQPANVWGVRDLHGLVWEWVLDFNSAMVTGDSRTGGDADKARFCGAGSIGARDARDYASFMRAAFRSSLEARFTTANLGFRCARDAAPPTKGRAR